MDGLLRGVSFEEISHSNSGDSHLNNCFELRWLPFRRVLGNIQNGLLQKELE